MLFAPAQNRWPERLALDIALHMEGSGDPVDEIIKRHELSKTDFLGLSKDPLFVEAVRKYRDEIQNNGLSFKLKARTQAEELLKTSWMLIHDAGVSPAVKADLIKSTVRWAGLEPKQGVEGEAGPGGGGVRISINIGGTTLQTTLQDEAAPAIETSYSVEE